MSTVHDAALLAGIAKMDPDASVRSAAIVQLRDQSLLTDIARQSSNHLTAIQALERLIDPSALADVVRSAALSSIRMAAVSRLNDRQLLADLLTTSQESHVHSAIVNKLDYQADLVHSEEWIAARARMDAKARMDEDTPVEKERIAACARMDEAALVKLAVSTEDERLGIEAIEHIPDRASLLSVMRNTQLETVRKSAIKKLSSLPHPNIVKRREEVAQRVARIEEKKAEAARRHREQKEKIVKHREQTESKPDEGIMAANKVAYPSEYLPSFPLNPMLEPVKGAPLKGQLLANVAAVCFCICSALEQWRSHTVTTDWPAYADRELGALIQACRYMNDKSGHVAPQIDINQVRRLAQTYLDAIKENPQAFAEFLNAELTLLGLTIDFGNTIGYGGALQNALDWCDHGGWG